MGFLEFLQPRRSHEELGGARRIEEPWGPRRSQDHPCGRGKLRESGLFYSLGKNYSKCPSGFRRIQGKIHEEPGTPRRSQKGWLESAITSK